MLFSLRRSVRRGLTRALKSKVNNDNMNPNADFLIRGLPPIGGFAKVSFPQASLFTGR